MRGVFVSNAYLTGPKFSEPAAMISAAAADMGVDMECVTNADLVFPVGDAEAAAGILGDADFVLFWDKDVRLAENIELCGYPVFNTSRCISVCDDKSLTHLALSRSGVPSIETVVCPMSFGGYTNTDFLRAAADTLGFPMVVKDCYGSFGQQVSLARDMESLEGLLSGPYRPRILQRYIECSSTDVRVEVVGGRAVEAVLRHGPDGDFRSNCTIGGRMERYSPTEAETDLAVRAAIDHIFGIDVVGVSFGRLLICKHGHGQQPHQQTQAEQYCPQSCPCFSSFCVHVWFPPFDFVRAEIFSSFSSSCSTRSAR